MAIFKLLTQGNFKPLSCRIRNGEGVRPSSLCVIIPYQIRLLFNHYRGCFLDYYDAITIVFAFAITTSSHSLSTFLLLSSFPFCSLSVDYYVSCRFLLSPFLVHGTIIFSFPMKNYSYCLWWEHKEKTHGYLKHRLIPDWQLSLPTA